jgi:excisionase family DNA binding protein
MCSAQSPVTNNPTKHFSPAVKKLVPIALSDSHTTTVNPSRRLSAQLHTRTSRPNASTTPSAASALSDKEQPVTEPIERPLVYTVTQTAALLGISRTHAYELVARGDLVHLRLGRRIVVPRHALEQLLDVGAERPAAS